MWKNKKNKAANTDPVETAEVTTPETPVKTPVELSTNKEFVISDINGTEIGKRVTDAEGEFIEEYFFVTVKRVDDSTYVPNEDTELSHKLYIEFEDTDGVLRFSPEPDTTRSTDDAAEETKNETPAEEAKNETPSETPSENKDEEKVEIPWVDRPFTTKEVLTLVRDEEISAANPFSHKIKKLLTEVIELM